MHQRRLLAALAGVLGAAEASFLRWGNHDGNVAWYPPQQTTCHKADVFGHGGYHAPAPTPTASPSEDEFRDLRMAKRATTAWVNSQTCGWYGDEQSLAMACTGTATCSTSDGVVACMDSTNTVTGFFTVCLDYVAVSQGLCSSAGPQTGCCMSSQYPHCGTAIWSGEPTRSRYFCTATAGLVTMYDEPYYLYTASTASTSSTSSTSSSTTSFSTTISSASSTTSTSTTTSPVGGGGSSTPVGAIVGGVVGGVAVIAIVAGVVAWMLLRKRRGQQAAAAPAAAPQSPPQQVMAQTYPPGPPPGGVPSPGLTTPGSMVDPKWAASSVTTSPPMSPTSPAPPYQNQMMPQQQYAMVAPAPRVSPPPAQQWGQLQPQQPAAYDPRYSVMSSELDSNPPVGHRTNPVEMG